MNSLNYALLDFAVRFVIAYLVLRYREGYYRKLIDEAIKDHKKLMAELMVSEESIDDKNKKLLDSFNKLRKL